MILIIGYGNPLRGDDGVGCVLARLLKNRLRRDDLHVQTLHQLTPELIAWIAGASYVIFIDANAETHTGTIAYEPVYPQTKEGAFTHNTNPSGLFAAARDWYGAVPHGLLISIGGRSFDYSDKLSPELTAMLPRLLDEIEQMVKSHIFATEK